MIDWNSSFKIARIANIEIRLHWTMVPYAAFALAPIIARDTIYAQLFLVSTLFILLHELGHCFMAKRRGLFAKKVVLYPLAGVAYTEVSRKHADNAWVAAAGPATNGAIAVVLLALMVATKTPIEPELFSLSFFCGHSLPEVAFRVNYLMIILNSLPLFPLDGGRVLLSILHIKYPPNIAMERAARITKIGAALLTLAGVVMLSVFVFILGVWLLNHAYTLQRQAKRAPKKMIIRTTKAGEPSIDWEELCKGSGVIRQEIYMPVQNDSIAKENSKQQKDSAAQKTVDKILQDLRDQANK